MLRLRIGSSVFVMVAGHIRRSGFVLAHPSPFPESFIVVHNVNVRGRYTAGVFQIVVFGQFGTQIVVHVIVIVIGRWR